ncbi:MAG: hypothetical protein IT258_20040 [Saprospiraceae bacterium]|nr:hypothetical protein [Saprospiraceae bacterium]
MKIVQEPEGIDFTLLPTRHSAEEAEEIALFIEKYKAEQKAGPVKVEVTASNPKELEFLLSLFKRLGLQWNLTNS